MSDGVADVSFHLCTEALRATRRSRRTTGLQHATEGRRGTRERRGRRGGVGGDPTDRAWRHEAKRISSPKSHPGAVRQQQMVLDQKHDTHKQKLHSGAKKEGVF